MFIPYFECKPKFENFRATNHDISHGIHYAGVYLNSSLNTNKGTQLSINKWLLKCPCPLYNKVINSFPQINVFLPKYFFPFFILRKCTYISK